MLCFKQAICNKSIVGATSLKQLKENIESIDIKLNSEIINEIKNIHLSDPNPCY